MHVQYIHVEVVRVELHLLEHGFERHGRALVERDHRVGLRAQRALDEAQQVLLVHAGRRVDVRVHFPIQIVPSSFN